MSKESYLVLSAPEIEGSPGHPPKLKYSDYDTAVRQAQSAAAKDNRPQYVVEIKAQIELISTPVVRRWSEMPPAGAILHGGEKCDED